MAGVVLSSSQPALGAIRLAWWREALEGLDRAIVPAEPRLKQAADALVARGVTGREISALEDAWLPLLDPVPWGDKVAEGLRRRGRLLFGIGARLLEDESSDVGDAGALWSLVDGQRYCPDAQSRDFLRNQAKIAASRLTGRAPPPLRPITVLAALAAIAILYQPPTPWRRGTVALIHRLRGTYPHV